MTAEQFYKADFSSQSQVIGDVYYVFISHTR